MTASDKYPRGNILVFGGNGFMGATTVGLLVRNDYSVTLVNRGHWYWDSEDLLKSSTHQIICDRYSNNITTSCKELVDFIKEVGYFDAVIDFSAMNGKGMENSLKLLYDKVGLYIYISSDSVYEISDRDYDGPSREDGAKLPQDPAYRDLLKKSDDYAWGKIEGEEVLKHYATKGLTYVALRLPDVIGPRDNFEDRFIRYQLWIKLAGDLKKPVQIPAQFLSSPTSMVYVEDVADIILKILQMKKDDLDNAYNLAFRERPTLYQVLKLVQKELTIPHVEYALDESNTYYLQLPSVKRGPVDITKATKDLQWEPTELDDAIAKTVQFFENAMIHGTDKPAFRRQRERAVQKLKESVFQGQEDQLDRAIDATYGPIKKKDEL